MPDFDYALSPVEVSPDLCAVHREAWSRIASPGSWWSGAQRVEAARLARVARAGRNEPPWHRETPVSDPDLLPERAVNLICRVAVDVHILDRVWAEAAVAELGDAAYVELCAVAVCVIAVDAFAEALGVEAEPLPEAKPGEPDGVRPEGMVDAGAFVPMADNAAGPNVGRALSLAPADNAMFFGLVGSMYALSNFTELVWEEGPLSRPQVELVAARVSAINECFY